jgi:two-component system, response regulator YesN
MRRLFLIDDERQVIDGIQSVFNLEEYGFAVVGAYTNPCVALADLPALRPDAMITDIKMPQMSGLDFSARALELLPELQVVILSGYDDFDFARTALRMGIADYLLKPVKKTDFEQMLGTLERRISKREALRGGARAAASASDPSSDADRKAFFGDVIDGDEDEAELDIAPLRGSTAAPAEGQGGSAPGARLSGDEFEALLLAISLKDAGRAAGILEDLLRPAASGVAGVDLAYSIALIILVKLFDLQESAALEGRPVAGEETTIRFLRDNFASVASLKEFLLGKISLVMSAESKRKASSMDKIVHSVVRYINDHVSEDLSLTDLASHAGLSKNYLCYVFKKEMKTTLLNYIVDVRMRRARELLRDGNHRMYEVGDMVGYHDYAYFSQIFKRQTGMTPSEYRSRA